jgi:phage terminase large subunit-like protein
MRPAEAAITLQEAIRAEEERRRGLVRLKAECEQDLMAFVRAFWRIVEPETPLVEGWVLHAIIDLLMAIADGHHTRAIINVPPGSMKSLLLNVFFPAWLWGPCNMPHLRFLSASYSTALPERDNDRFRQMIVSPEYRHLWGDRVRLVRAGMGLVENSRTGWKRAASSGGGTTGHRGDYILLDDVNDPNSVESDDVRGSTNRWLTEVIPDRLNNLATGVIINLQQRTHEEDATGILAKHWRDFAWLMIPMEFDPLRATPVVLRTDQEGQPLQVWRDPRGVDEDGLELEGLYQDSAGRMKVRMGSPMAKADGALCWPERFPPVAVADLKAIKQEYAWAGQYQQSPTVRGGGIIRRDWWQLWPNEDFPILGTVVGSLDTAYKEGERNDYNAFTSWGAFARPDGVPKLILTSAWQERCSLPELIRRTAESCYEAKVDYLLIEDKARGHDVAAEILRQYAEAPWQTILIPANGRGAFSGDKMARLRAVSGMFAGDVRKVPLPGGAPGETMDLWTGGMIYDPGREWSEEVVDQVCSFPTAAHDDYVDSVSMALSWIRRHGVVVRQVEHEAAETEARRYRSPVGVPYAITG